MTPITAVLAFAAAATGAVELHPYGQRGWAATESSVVLYDSSGTVVSELPLGRWEDKLADETVRRSASRGGISGGGRFAWSLEEVRRVRPGRRGETTLESVRLLRYLGTYGQELWRDDLVDAPQGLEPLYASEDGETVLVFERRDATRSAPARWSAAAYFFTGNRLIEASQPGIPSEAGLAPNGRYAFVRWTFEGAPSMTSFLNLDARSRLDAASGDLPPAPLSVDSMGRIFAGDKYLFELK